MRFMFPLRPHGMLATSGPGACNRADGETLRKIIKRGVDRIGTTESLSADIVRGLI